MWPGFWFRSEEDREIWERQQKVNYLLAKKRTRAQRWKFPVKARVTHPKYGSITVPHASKYAALLCACDVWKCSFAEISGAEVRGIQHDHQ